MLLSGSGTFLSIYLADEVYDAGAKHDMEEFKHHIHWKRAIFSVTIIALTVVFYEFLLTELGINIPLF